MPQLPSLPDDQLTQLAMEIASNQVFTDRHLCPGEDPRTLDLIFMPLSLGAMSEWSAEEVKQVGMIYEHMDEAGPRSVNGYPIFFSMKMLNREDASKVTAKVRKIMDAMKSAAKST